jgi:hypothetical protein
MCSSSQEANRMVIVQYYMMVPSAMPCENWFCGTMVWLNRLVKRRDCSQWFCQGHKPRILTVKCLRGKVLVFLWVRSSSRDNISQVSRGPWLDCWGISPIPSRSKKFVCHEHLPDQLRGRPCRLSSGYHRLFLYELKWPGREAEHSLHLVPRLKYVQLYLHSIIHLHGVMID